MPQHDPNRALRWFLWGISALGLAVEYTEASETGKKKMYTAKARLAKRKENFDNAVKVAAPIAEKLGVPMGLVLAILSIESDFDPGSVNLSPRAKARGGAWGVGQVTLTTATDYTSRFPDVAKELWPKFNGDPKTLLDLETNLGLTITHLKRSLAKFDGDVLKAGTAFHQGNGNVQKAIDAKGETWYNALMPLGKRYYELLKDRIPAFSRVA